MLSLSKSLGGIIEQHFCSRDDDPIFKNTNGEGIAGVEGGDYSFRLAHQSFAQN